MSNRQVLGLQLVWLGFIWIAFALAPDYWTPQLLIVGGAILGLLGIGKLKGENT